MSTPLDRLHTAFAADMDAVNGHILNQIGSDVPLIPKVAKHLIAAGGKRIRPLLTLASTAIAGGEMSRAHGLAAAVEFIHSATLLHDDVVDESTQRRGLQVANLVYGNAQAVLVGDFLFARAFQLMTEDGSLDILRILSSASAIISEGEVMQLQNKGNLQISMADYIQIITAKTAALFAAACAVGSAIANQPIDHSYAYGLNLGIAFQIADDAMDYQGGLGKSTGDDFREGKLTAPVLIAMQHADKDEQKFWARALNPEKQTKADLKTAQAIIAKHDAISKAHILAHEYGDKAKAALTHMPEHSLKADLIDLVDFAIKRG